MYTDVLDALKDHTRDLTGNDSIKPDDKHLHRHGNDLYYYNGPSAYIAVNIAGVVYATDSRTSNDPLIDHCDCCDHTQAAHDAANAHLQAFMDYMQNTCGCYKSDILSGSIQDAIDTMAQHFDIYP